VRALPPSHRARWRDGPKRFARTRGDRLPRWRILDQEGASAKGRRILFHALRYGGHSGRQAGWGGVTKRSAVRQESRPTIPGSLAGADEVPSAFAKGSATYRSKDGLAGTDEETVEAPPNHPGWTSSGSELDGLLEEPLLTRGPGSSRPDFFLGEERKKQSAVGGGAGQGVGLVDDLLDESRIQFSGELRGEGRGDIVAEVVRASARATEARPASWVVAGANGEAPAMSFGRIGMAVQTGLIIVVHVMCCFVYIV